MTDRKVDPINIVDKTTLKSTLKDFLRDKPTRKGRRGGNS